MIPRNHNHLRSTAATNGASALFVLFALMVCAALLAAPLAVRADDPARSNLASNAGLETFTSYGTYHNGQGTFDLSVASGWTKFLISGTQPRFMTDLDYADAFAGSGGITRHLEGNNCQNLWLAHPFVAGIYQQINVTSGKAYTAKVMWLANVGSTVSNPDGKMVVQVGIDPSGGTNAAASSVIWGDPYGIEEDYETILSAARAVASKITMFVKVNNTTDVDPDWNAGWIDAARVEQAPECTITSPASSGTGTFTVQWNSTQDPPNGDLTGDYEVQYKDGVNGTWTRWTGKTSSTSKVFTGGQLGHTYYFRARAWANYNGTEMYGAFAPNGDTSTLVGNAVAGIVDRYDGYVRPGAVVSLVGIAGSATTNSNGYYVLALPGAGTYSIRVDAAGYASPPPVALSVTGTTGLMSAPLTVRAADDPVANGDFENVLGGEWLLSSTDGIPPAEETDAVRSGAKSLALRRGATGAGQSLVRQTVDIAGMWKPTLSFYASMPAASAGDSLEIGTFEGSTYTPLKTITGTSDWTHNWVRLIDQDSYYTGTLHIFFRATQAGTTPFQVYLDEVSLGSAPGGPSKSYLPLLTRND